MPTDTLDGTKRPSFPDGALWGMSLCTGIVFALIAFGLLRYACDRERIEQARERALRSLDLVESVIDASFGKTAILAEHIARQLNGADKARIPGILSQYKSLRPDAGFSVFDRNGDFLFLPLADGEPAPHAAPLLYTVRTMVHQALVGKVVRGFTQLRGFLSMSIAVPVRSGAAGVFVVALPLDSLLLQDMKELSRVEIAIFPFADENARVIGGLSAAVGTFATSPVYGNFWPDIGDSLAGRVLVAPETIPLGDGALHVAISSLAEPDGEPVGVLVAAPALPGDSAYPVWHLAASLLSGLAAALFSGYCLHRRSLTLLVPLVDAINALADGAFPPQGDRRKNNWPSPLEDAFSRLSTTLRRYSARARKAEREQSSLREREDEPEKSVRDDGDFLRLFSSAPVGTFQIEESGLFLRVNQTFASLLGYYSPSLFMAECSTFSELFLYGDEIRNPLPALTRGDECHVVSLRRRDGRVRQYGLMIAAVTSFTGDRGGTLEGFLIDREPEEKAARAESERDFAKKQRSSLALLLAATCRQTLSHISVSRRAYLAKHPEEDKASASDMEENAAVPSPRELSPTDGQEDGDASARERRLSVLPITSVLNDIYQIALTEAVSAPPLSLPIESGRFLQSLCRQILPGITTRGISLRCEISHDLPPRFSGPAPLLRHALERTFLAVTAPVLGGLACIRASRDPNAPKSPGVERVLFSVSWTLFPRDIALGARNLVDAPNNQDHAVSFEARADSEADPAKGSHDPGVLEMADEEEVLRYLAQRMRGELLEGNFANDFRMISLIVPLAHLASDEGEDGSGKEFPEDLHLAVSPVDDPDEQAIASLKERYADVPIAALDVLAPDDPGPSAEYAGEEKDERSDPELDILLVDNNLNNRLLFSLFLRDTRHRITEAHDGQEGVEAFSHAHFDVIFLDMEMPLMNGYQATRIIRAMEADSGRPATPIVAMTTYALPEFQRQCMLAGCTDFMSKPFNKIVLANVLEAFVQMKANK